GIMSVSSSPGAIAPLTSPARRGILSILFNRSHNKEAEMRNFLSGEGSISQSAWQEMGKESNLKTRLKALEQLQMLARNRRLQVSTLEAIYHETCDLLEVEEAKEAVISMLIALAKYQQEQIGLALRDTFFKEICRIGLTSLSLDWLTALTVNGEKIAGFEYDIIVPVRDWIHVVLDLSQLDHPLAIRVLQIAQQLVRMNAGFLREAALDEIVHLICVRTCHRVDHLTHECMVLLDTILKFGHIPDEQLFALVTTLCTVITVNRLGKTAWGLMRDLLRSRSGHTALGLLIEIIGKGKQCPQPKVIVGAVSAVSMALWGSQRVETLRCQPGAVLPALASAMEAGALVMSEVFVSMKRLLAKYGKDLQQLSWHCVLQLLEKAVKLCREVPCEDKRAELSQQLHQLIDIVEELNREGEYGGSPEAMYALIERCADERPTDSVLALMDYRANCIDPLSANWLHCMAELVQRYLKEGNSSAVREKAVSILHNAFIKYHVLYEKDVIVDLMIPVLSKAVDETNIKVQYQMLNVLFDVAKTVAMRVNSERDLFSLVIQIIKSFLSADFSKSTSCDNVEIVAGGICEVLHERFAQFTMIHLRLVLHMLCDHLRSHYAGIETNEVGSEIRERLFSALLSIICDPYTGQLVKTGESEVLNTHIVRAGYDTEGEFKWSEICEVTTLALEKELWFPVLRVILHHLCRVLEFRGFVFTAGERRVRQLKDAVIRLHYKRNDLLSEIDADVKRVMQTGEEKQKRNDIDLAKYLCPVLSRLINYYRDENICKIMVDSIPSVAAGCQQAIMACDLAVQIIPECMAPLARQLMAHLASLQPSAVLAIPIIELSSDSSAVENFYQFFQMKHFKCVVDVLAPYSNVHRFNTFIIAAVFRNLMRWYVRMPESIREEMTAYILEKVDAYSLSKSSSTSEMGRQQSGDSCTTPSSSVFSVGPIPDTPPPMANAGGTLSATRSADPGVTEDAVREKMAHEARDALVAFMRYGKVGEANESTSINESMNLVEQKTEHWVVNDSIISLSVYTEGGNKRTSNVITSESDHCVKTTTAQQQNDEIITDVRRRHQSAVHRPERLKQVPRPAALDDSYAISRSSPRAQPTATVSWTQIVVRHIYGKQTWLMRSLSAIPEDFDAVPCSNNADAASLVLHLCADQKAIKISCADKNKISRSFRNIDRISALEMHTVGVVYVGYGQTKEAEILANIYGSERYVKFIRMLGETISLENNPGGLMPSVNGQFTYACTDAVSRLVFHVATLMPKRENDQNCNEKKKFIGNDYVSVIFNESGKPYRLGTISGKFAYVALEVVPQDESHMLVTVHARREIASWLAMSRAFLPDQRAALLVRKLVLRAQLSVNVWRREEEEKGPPYIGLTVERLRAIRAFAQASTKHA
uniref:Rap-GAP domain-containing protein n=1 Tax=Parascaris univalens TaxID=6257 RepID=A0A914ZTV8_PARUN